VYNLSDGLFEPAHPALKPLLFSLSVTNLAHLPLLQVTNHLLSGLVGRGSRWIAPPVDKPGQRLLPDREGAWPGGAGYIWR